MDLGNGRDLKLNPDRGGSYYKDTQGRHHMTGPDGKCLDGYEEGDPYDAKTFEEMEEMVYTLHPELKPVRVDVDPTK